MNEDEIIQELQQQNAWQRMGTLGLWASHQASQMLFQNETPFVQLSKEQQQQRALQNLHSCIVKNIQKKPLDAVRLFTEALHKYKNLFAQCQKTDAKNTPYKEILQSLERQCETWLSQYPNYPNIPIPQAQVIDFCQRKIQQEILLSYSTHQNAVAKQMYQALIHAAQKCHREQDRQGQEFKTVFEKYRSQFYHKQYQDMRDTTFEDVQNVLGEIYYKWTTYKNSPYIKTCMDTVADYRRPVEPTITTVSTAASAKL